MLALATGVSSAHAQLLVRLVNLFDLARGAGVIVHGRVVEVRREGHPDFPNIPTVHVKLEVLENIRDAGAGHFSFRQYLDEIELQAVVPGQAPVMAGKYGKHGYAVGQELVLFLFANSRYGLTSPVGGGQGRFLVSRDLQGRRTVVNEFGNCGLFRDVAETARKAGLPFSPTETRLLEQAAGPAELEGFLSLVKRLALLGSVR